MKPYNRRRYKKTRVSRPVTKAGVDKAVQRALRPEFKWKVTQSNGTTIDTTPTIVDSFYYNIGQGGATTQRIGHKIKPAGFSFRYTLSFDTASEGSWVRMMLYLDKQCNGASATNADILDDVTAGDNIVSLYNVPNSSRFKIIYDKIIQLNANNTTAYRKFHYKFPSNYVVKYDATATAITDLANNNIGLMFMSNEAVNVPVIVYNFKLRFTDA